MCDKEATSREHVPPRAIFPKSKDMANEPQKLKNLITVPSCDRHNSEKSGLDEYLAFILISCFENNSLTMPPLIKKMARASNRNSKAIYDLIDGAEPIKLYDHPTAVIRVDLGRFNRGFEQIAHGLYFHEFSRPWFHEFGIHTPIFKYTIEPNAEAANKIITDLQNRCAIYFAPLPFKGENPRYFKYQIMALAKERGTEIIIRTIFYEGMEVYCLSKENWKEEELEIFRKTHVRT